MVSFNLFSSSQEVFNSPSFFFKTAISSLIAKTLFLDISSLSFLIASNSICNPIILRVKVSSSNGTESICTLIVAQASSTKSIALSGKKRSVIYLSDKVAAAIKALSLMVTPWNNSNLGFNPLKIVIVSSTLGALTSTL